MIIVEMAKEVLPIEVMPTVNIWSAQTPVLIKAISTGAATMIDNRETTTHLTISATKLKAKCRPLGED
jgi:hypothetical protein